MDGVILTGSSSVDERMITGEDMGIALQPVRFPLSKRYHIRGKVYLIEADLEILDSVEISALNDIDFGQYGGTDTGALNAGDSFCVYRNGGDSYTLTATSNNGKFSLVGAVGSDEIDYTVKLAGAATGSVAVALAGAALLTFGVATLARALPTRPPVLRPNRSWCGRR